MAKEFVQDSPLTVDIPDLGLNRQDLLGVGAYTYVYRLDSGTVRKVGASDPDNLPLAKKSIRREGEIYEHLGDHPRVIRCVNRSDLLIDLEYAPNGDLASFLQSQNDLSDETRIRFAREAIEAIVFIHSKGIIHSDIAARQFLVDSEHHVKLSDFGFSSFGDGDVLGFENAAHLQPRDIDGTMPSTFQSDLFALGSTLYEIMTGGSPYRDKSAEAIAQLYKEQSFPDVTAVLKGQIIMGCWHGHFKTATEALEGLDAVS